MIERSLIRGSELSIGSSIEPPGGSQSNISVFSMARRLLAEYKNARREKAYFFIIF